MIINKNKTFLKKLEGNIQWYIVDAQNYKLGRLTSRIAYILKNKHETEYSPYQKGKAYVIIINSKKIKTTGKKNQQKIYRKHSGRPGSMKIERFGQLQERIPNRIIEHALKGMLPKNNLGRELFKKVKIYPSNEHPHQSQNPITINID